MTTISELRFRLNQADAEYQNSRTRGARENLRNVRRELERHVREIKKSLPFTVDVGVKRTSNRARIDKAEHFIVYGNFQIGKMIRNSGDSLCGRVKSDDIEVISSGIIPDCGECLRLAEKITTESFEKIST